MKDQVLQPNPELFKRSQSTKCDGLGFFMVPQADTETGWLSNEHGLKRLERGRHWRSGWHEAEGRSGLKRRFSPLIRRHIKPVGGDLESSRVEGIDRPNVKHVHL